MTPGTLFLVATPIGNLEDITARALRVLRESDLIACEDTRRTARLLTRYGITTPRQSYHEHNEAERAGQLLELLRAGKRIALVADAGMPLVSDPGHRLVSACRAEGIPVTPIPGPSAAISALAASGLPSDAFFFAGFLPPRSSARRRKLEDLAGIGATLVFYEAPHRLLESLRDVAGIYGPRRACVARELTKLHEEWLCGPLNEILRQLEQRPSIRGEVTLVVEGGSGKAAPDADYPDSLLAHLEEEMRGTGAGQKEALKAVARRRGLSRREAYDLLVKEKQHRKE